MARAVSRYRDVVQVDDVLGAMADSVAERQPKAFQPKLLFHDRQVAFKGKVCSCQYLCSGGPATVKCHSCSIYDPSGSAFFCDLCFKIRHPWHRIPHIYTAIDADESIEHTLKIAHRVAEAKRFEQEGADVMDTLLREKARLVQVADDEKLDNQVWDYGRRMVALEQYITQLRKKIHDDTYHHSLRKSLVAESSEMNQLRQLQQSEELRKLAESFQHELPSVESPRPVAQYAVYRPAQHDGDEPEFVLVPPVLLTIEDTPGPEPPDPLEGHAADSPPPTTLVAALSGAPSGPPSGSTTNPALVGAAVRIQKVVKGFLARRIVSSIVATRTVHVWSTQYARDYFYDRVTGVSSWTPSKLLRGEHMDELEYLTESAGSVKWSCKASAKRRRTSAVTATRAVAMLQSFARCVGARNRLLAAANEVYRRVLDEDSQLWYYANIRTGETSWNKPALFLSKEPPVLLPEERQQRSSKAQRMSAQWR